ncbi:hypothetical protein ACNFCK_20715 [Pseudomonas sp. NY15366]
MEQIYQLAKEFRAALERTPRISLRTTLGSSNFPDACCDDASMLLAAYLSDNGFPGSIRVSGVNGGASEELKSHIWLLWSDLIIDITADQFTNYGMAPIIVSQKTEFHESFEIEDKENADFRVKFENDPRWLSNFSSDYKIVLSQLIPN